MDRIKWCFIGIPDHEGVYNVGGRLGAADGPSALFRVFNRFRGREGVQESLGARALAGPMTRDVATNHRLAADLIREQHSSHGLSVIVGGGHDHGYSHLLGVAESIQAGKAAARIGCINIDPHFDVRKPSPAITSGSPFYLALESGLLKPGNFIEFGIQKHCNSPELWSYIESKKVKVVPFEALRHGKAAQEFEKALSDLSGRCDAVVISLDLDSASSAFAPGVSAPQTEGFTSTDIIEMMTIAGSAPKVCSLGIFELNPLLDIDDATARLGATAAYHFVAQALSRSPAAKA